MPDGARKLIFAYGVEGYGKRDRHRGRAMRQRLVDVLAYTLGRARVPPGTHDTEKQEDGGITLLPAGDGVDEPRLITSLIDALEKGLADVNAGLADGARIRLRAAFDAGAARPAPGGYSGDAVTAACRLRDAPVVKDVLSHSPGDLVIVVADHLYRDIRADARDRTFVRASLTVRELTATAWIHLAGGAVPASLPRSAPLSPHSPERTVAPLTADLLEPDPGPW